MGRDTVDKKNGGNNKKSVSPFSSFGPALLVTAAFIGPGTVLTASKAGANYGFSLIWAVIFSVIATIVLQEMAARLGIVTGGGLAQAIRNSISHPLAKVLALTLVLGAILVGNAAYQTGNLLGASLGLKQLLQTDTEVTKFDTAENDLNDKELDQSTPANDSKPSPSASDDSDGFWNITSIGAVAFGLTALIIVWIGRLGLVQSAMTFLVALMSMMFVFSAIACRPNWSHVLQGTLPSLPEGTQWTGVILFVIGLIGTTVVPYNLFLHASSAAEKWHGEDDAQKSRFLRSSFWDTLVSVLIGGVVTISILITMSVAFSDSNVPLSEGTQISGRLEGTFGSWARILFAIGLCAAGLSSSVTAPIAAAYATAGCFGWAGKLSDIRLKFVASMVICVGVVLALSLGKSPLEIIILAQVANGLLLPLVALFLLYVANQASLLGRFKNSWIKNVFACSVILITLALASAQMISAYGKIKKRLDPKQSTSLIQYVSPIQENKGPLVPQEI